MNAPRPSVFLRVLTVIGLIVLGVVMLHLAAVGGIYAFNSFKANHKERAATTEVSAPAATPGFYTVKKGDTATSIAHSFGLTAEEFLKLNRITDPKELQPGQTLKVPSRKS